MLTSCIMQVNCLIYVHACSSIGDKNAQRICMADPIKLCRAKCTFNVALDHVHACSQGRTQDICKGVL